MTMSLPPVRGRLLANEALGPFTWFRVGGPAEHLFLPADEGDLADFLAGLDPAVPVTPIGVGSNLIVRDGGVAGVVIRLAGRAFAGISVEGERLRAGAGALDAQLARAAAQAGLSGLEFYAGIPGAIGGAITMNAGCYGAETKDVLIEAEGIDRAGRKRRFSNAELGFHYRGNSLAEPIIWTSALFRGRPDRPEAVAARMADITARREESQPIREKTGGSTFRNPEGHSAWKLIDEAGLRGMRHGGAQISEKHCNFLINTGDATAADIEALGELARARVLATSGVDLHWEIKRIGRA